jgi:hypothetical protein
MCKILFDSLKWYENKTVREDTGLVLLVALCHDAVLGAEDTHRQLTEKYGWSAFSQLVYGRFLFRISTRTTIVLFTAVFSGLPQSLQRIYRDIALN